MATQNYNLFGVAKVEIGDVLSDGTMQTTLTKYTRIKKGTASLNIEAPQHDQVELEDSDFPYKSLPNDGEVQEMSFTLLGIGPDGLVDFKGGTNATGVWEAPNSKEAIEKAVKITTREDSGYYWEIRVPRSEIRAAISGDLTKSDIIGLNVTCKILQAYDTSTGELKTSIYMENIAS